MRYRKCKYVLDEACVFEGLPFGEHINTMEMNLEDGELTIWPGFTWDGPSWPAIDTDDFMSAALVHDALYKLHRMGLLDNREAADITMREIALDCGMSKFRAWYTYRGVRMFGGKAAAVQAEPMYEL